MSKSYKSSFIMVNKANRYVGRVKMVDKGN